MNECLWKIHDFDNQIWETECGELHYFSEGGPDENRYTFCPYCRNPIKEPGKRMTRYEAMEYVKSDGKRSRMKTEMIIKQCIDILNSIFKPDIKTWIDPETGLEWQIEGPEEKMTWHEAKEYAKSLGSLGDGWRIPTRKELCTIIDDEKFNPACVKNLKCHSSYYWSSTTYAYNTSDAWSVYFDNGSVNYNDKANSFYVRCVRSRQ